MLQAFTIRKYWLLTLCLVVCSITSMYSQDIPDNYLGIDVPTLTAQYRANGVGDDIIEFYINQLREKETKRFLEVLEKEKALQEQLKLKNSETSKSSLISANNGSNILINAKVSAKALSAVMEENQIVNSGVNTKFSIEPASPGATYEWVFYDLDNVTVKDSATTAIAYQKYTLPGIYRITLEVKDASGCISYSTKNIEVKDSGLCVRKPINFAFETTSTNLKYTWTATNTAGVLVNEVINKTGLYTYTPTLPGDFVIKLVATGEGKCETVFQEKITVGLCEEDDGGGENCKNHIAIVVDESGSIDETEAKRIRAQLKSFIYEQAVVNETGNKMWISLIGLSDTDGNLRNDHILERAVSKGDLLKDGVVYNWIENYGRRYGTPGNGISEGSDYWKSGLDLVTTSNFNLKPKLVFLITDGCQTTNPEALKTTMQKFDNYQNSPDKSEDKPHLYVVGINNGFYVDNVLADPGTPRNQDPNFVPSLRKGSYDSTSSLYLGKSLQYLFDYQDNAFPLERINGFDSASYFAHNDFTMLNDEPYYFSDNIIKAGVGCGKLSVKDYCSNCFSFQPKANGEYLLSAWVKEETNIQVKNYENTEINIVFYDDAEAVDPDPSDPAAPSQVINTVTLKPSGAIIDGWQRISGKFTVPENTITAGVVLINNNTGIPVYFDDLRIHPMEGSLKTFVYDSETFKLMSELDENNYSTFYEYDNEGGLVRVKKETSQGIKTIQETRSGNFINPQ
ncbi:PKD domain-containing protein [Flavobacterium sp. SLB02]|uniref:PKD domain-containing protein n=1 Tax=Flavobacterium sp. SLB02 TaxID=2665645 RepID=UPI0012A8F9B0|nr:PKD domain-containing protein [Flavobacterium sp. SLB02]QGK75261.1 hypothetical protein GIY83_14605 [Flavobacterium sp. SLB02]